MSAGSSNSKGRWPSKSFGRGCGQRTIAVLAVSLCFFLLTGAPWTASAQLSSDSQGSSVRLFYVPKLGLDFAARPVSSNSETSDSVALIFLESVAIRARRKYSDKLSVADGSGTSALTKRQSTIVLTDDNDVSYYGTITLGTPAQQFNVLFGITGTNTTATAVLQYGSGTLAGVVGTDTLRIGSVALSGTTFIRASSAQAAAGTGGFPTVYDGILGLGYEAKEATGLNLTTPFTALVQSNVLPQPIVSLYLNTTVVGNTITQTNPQGGLITFGGFNQALVGRGGFTWNKVVTKGYWEIALTSVVLGSNTTVYSTSSVGATTTAVIDSGTSYILAPTSHVQRLAAAVNATRAGTQLGSGTYTMDCAAAENMPDLTIKFASSTVTIPGADLVIQDASVAPPACYMLVLDFGTESQFWLFGQVLLRKSYTVFSRGNDTVGFAAVCNPPGSCSGSVSTTTSSATAAASPIATAAGGQKGGAMGRSGASLWTALITTLVGLAVL
ncbi:hypothetical protein HDU93_000038 [Gonapodya sp. JEL0774]|nr:hypothetical protein HDU93_000038 [Gonapodya sp. JEL0774]